MPKKPLVSKKNIIALASAERQLGNATAEPVQPAAMDKTEGLFDELCSACREGDREKVESLVSNFAAPINFVDEWQCSPLYWACLCGHFEVVKYLLENGAKCDRNTFQGERCLYGALTKQIRDLLLSYKLSKAIDERQPYLYFLSQLQERPDDYFSDITFKVRVPLSLDDLLHPGSSIPGLFTPAPLYRDFSVHRCVLATRSTYFAHQLLTQWRDGSEVHMNNFPFHPTCFEAVLRYMYVGQANEVGPELVNNMILTAESLGLPELAAKYAREKEGQGSKKSAVRDIEAEEVMRIQADFWKFLMEVSFKAVARIASEDTARDAESEQEVPEDNENVYYYTGYDNFVPQSLTVILDDVGLANTSDATSNGQQSFDPIQTHADIAIRIDNTLFPCHKTFLLRSEYFAAMFNGSFSESTVTSTTIAYTTAASEPLATLVLPLITLHAPTPPIFRVCLEFLYTDRCDIDTGMAYDVLVAADMLLLDRLKAIAAITITNNPKPLKEDVYKLARAAVDLRVDRLEKWCSKWFADHLDEILEEEDFAALVRESAEGIKGREETDTLPIIDDLRYWLGKKYCMFDEDLDGKGRVNYTLMEHWTDLETEYNSVLKKVDRLLDRLGLEAYSSLLHSRDGLHSREGVRDVGFRSSVQSAVLPRDTGFRHLSSHSRRGAIPPRDMRFRSSVQSTVPPRYMRFREKDITSRPFWREQT
ncbi:hypothetical protein BC937DRAFT_94650 [Endogone sp. FLAS-F59071]|nr:hypothetical protein BC937DRAFT_94650 [Endogone sp. FLAS-F59071]|eukprot:RUS20677.1 hypothetical protein BC937DRAFT_94650 [Endogone sp. FLAS-F59071]